MDSPKQIAWMSLTRLIPRPRLIAQGFMIQIFGSFGASAAAAAAAAAPPIARDARAASPRGRVGSPPLAYLEYASANATYSLGRINVGDCS
jgi:hypothetical protein